MTRSVGKILPLRMAGVSLTAGESTPSSLPMSRKRTGPALVEFLISFTFYCGSSSKSQNRQEQPSSPAWQFLLWMAVILLGRCLCLRGSRQLSGLFYSSSPFLQFQGMGSSGNINCICKCHKGRGCSGHIATFRNVILKQKHVLVLCTLIVAAL